MAAAGMSRPIAAMAPPRFTNNFAMKSVTRISVDDFHSIRNWWCAGVSFVEKPDQEWFQYVTETENAQCLCLKIEGEVESYCQADIFDKTAHISIASNPSSLRRGFAVELINHLEKELKKMSVANMKASVEVENGASHSLALKMGFARTSRSNAEPEFVDYKKAI